MLQGLLFSALLFYRFFTKKVLSDLWIAILLLLMAWHRTTYMIGFMGWYDNFKNTKINYALIYFGLAIGPLIYLYVKALVKPTNSFKKFHLWHFLPMMIYFFYHVILYLYDSAQPNFTEGYEGVMMQNYAEPYIE